jgi:hypothetical protein
MAVSLPRVSSLRESGKNDTTRPFISYFLKNHIISTLFYSSCLGFWYQWKGEGGEGRMWEGEYGANAVYTYM